MVSFLISTRKSNNKSVFGLLKEFYPKKSYTFSCHSNRASRDSAIKQTNRPSSQPLSSLASAEICCHSGASSEKSALLQRTMPFFRCSSRCWWWKMWKYVEKCGIHSSCATSAWRIKVFWTHLLAQIPQVLCKGTKWRQNAFQKCCQLLRTHVMLQIILFLGVHFFVPCFIS